MITSNSTRPAEPGVALSAGGGQRAMPAYRPIAKLWALRIASVVAVTPQAPDGNAQRYYPSWLHFEDKGFDPVQVQDVWVAAHRPAPGDFYVVLANGAVGTLTEKQLHDTYVPEADWGLRRGQEEKYGINELGRYFNRETGEVIPDDEVTITFRAKDALLKEALLAYRAAAEREGLADVVRRIDDKINAVLAFQNEHAARVRLPN